MTFIQASFDRPAQLNSDSGYNTLGATFDKMMARKEAKEFRDIELGRQAEKEAAAAARQKILDDRIDAEYKRINDVRNVNANVTNINGQTADQGAFLNETNDNIIQAKNLEIAKKANAAASEYLNTKGTDEEKAALVELQGGMTKAASSTPIITDGTERWGALADNQKYDNQGRAVTMGAKELAINDQLNNQLALTSKGGLAALAGTDIDKYKNASVALDAVARDRYDELHKGDKKAYPLGTKGREIEAITQDLINKTAFADYRANERGAGGTLAAKNMANHYNILNGSNVALNETGYAQAAKDGYFDGHLNIAEAANKANQATFAGSQIDQIKYNAERSDKDRQYQIQLAQLELQKKEAAAREKQRLADIKAKSELSKILYQIKQPTDTVGPDRYVAAPKSQAELKKYDSDTRFYTQKFAKVISEKYPNLSVDIDPKTGQAKITDSKKGIGSSARTTARAAADMINENVELARQHFADPKNKGTKFTGVFNSGPAAGLQASINDISTYLTGGNRGRDEILKRIETASLDPSNMTLVKGEVQRGIKPDAAKQLDNLSKLIDNYETNGIQVPSKYYDAYVMLSNSSDTADAEAYRDFRKQQAKDASYAIAHPPKPVE